MVDALQKTNHYVYDSLGQVKSGKKYWADGTPVAGQQFEYGHDDIGNRTDTKAGGDPSGAGLRSASYSANSLNQYSSRTNSTAVDVLGQALVSATVTVNGNATYRKNDYFQHALSVANSGGPVAQSVTVAASLNGTNATPGTGYVLVPQAQETFQYDADGNLTNDSLWSYTWDAENRLITIERKLASLPSASLAKRVEFTYDWQGRRVRKLVKNSSLQVISDTRFVYDGWNLVAELNSDLSLKTSYAWGLDLSGSIQGAGGVGGLLFAVYYSPSTEVYFPAYDGNGNIISLCKGSDGSWAAQYEYGPFGELIRATGPMAKANPFRFSTKYQDEETGLLYYGFRFYSPSLGRWLSRDPIEEMGGVNLYGFVANNPLNIVDRNGMDYYPPEHVLKLPPSPTPPDPQNELEALRRQFEAWYRDQNAHMDWLKQLPDCPCELPKRTICVLNPSGISAGAPARTTEVFVVPSGWGLVDGLWSAFKLNKYHPGGSHDMRQLVKPGAPGQQCVYDRDGKLITHGPGAGTPDRAGSKGGVAEHLDADVYPFEWAMKLDGNPNVPNPSGHYFQKYMEVRPPNLGKDPTTGKPCPKIP